MTLIPKRSSVVVSNNSSQQFRKVLKYTFLSLTSLFAGVQFTNFFITKPELNLEKELNQLRERNKQ